MARRSSRSCGATAAKAQDYARRHGVPRAYDRADDLIEDADVDAVYIATPPSSHCELALRVAAAGKPCLVEKPMALNHAECLRMIEAFRVARPAAVGRVLPPRAAAISASFAIDCATAPSVASRRFTSRSPRRRSTGADATNWRIDPAVSGAGLVLRSRVSLLRPARFSDRHESARVADIRFNTAGAYAAEDVTVAAFEFRDMDHRHRDLELQRVGEERCHDIHRLRQVS